MKRQPLARGSVRAREAPDSPLPMRARTLLFGLAALGGGLWYFREQVPWDRIRALADVSSSEEPAEKATSKRKRAAGATLSGAAGTNAESGKLSPPTPKPCLDPPTGEDLPEQGMTGSRGLSQGEVRAAMSSVVSHALPCFADGDSGTVVLEVTAGCDGRVSDIAISDAGGYPTDVTGCVVETLRNAAFPAHDLPGGFSFTYPVTYTAP